MSAVELAPARRTPPGTALARLRTFVSPFTGVVHGIDEITGLAVLDNFSRRAWDEELGTVARR